MYVRHTYRTNSVDVPATRASTDHVPIFCQGKKKLDLSGPTSGVLEKVAPVSDSDQESSDEEKEKKANELTQGQQDIPWV